MSGSVDTVHQVHVAFDGRLGVVASSLPRDEWPRWETLLDNHARMIRSGDVQEPEHALSWVMLPDNWGALVRRRRGESGDGRNYSHVLLGRSSRFDVGVALGLERWDGWRDVRPDKGAVVDSLEFDEVKDVSDRARSDLRADALSQQPMLRQLLAQLADQPHARLTVVGVDDKYRVPLAWAFRLLGHRLLRTRLGGDTRKWSFSTYETFGGQYRPGQFAELVFAEAVPARGAVRDRLLVKADGTRQPTADPTADRDADRIVEDFIDHPHELDAMWGGPGQPAARTEPPAGGSPTLPALTAAVEPSYPQQSSAEADDARLQALQDAADAAAKERQRKADAEEAAARRQLAAAQDPGGDLAREIIAAHRPVTLATVLSAAERAPTSSAERQNLRTRLGAEGINDLARHTVAVMDNDRDRANALRWLVRVIFGPQRLGDFTGEHGRSAVELAQGLVGDDRNDNGLAVTLVREAAQGGHISQFTNAITYRWCRQNNIQLTSFTAPPVPAAALPNGHRKEVAAARRQIGWAVGVAAALVVILGGWLYFSSESQPVPPGTAAPLTTAPAAEAKNKNFGGPASDLDGDRRVYLLVQEEGDGNNGVLLARCPLTLDGDRWVCPQPTNWQRNPAKAYVLSAYSIPPEFVGQFEAVLNDNSGGRDVVLLRAGAKQLQKLEVPPDPPVEPAENTTTGGPSEQPGDADQPGGKPPR